MCDYLRTRSYPSPYSITCCRQMDELTMMSVIDIRAWIILLQALPRCYRRKKKKERKKDREAWPAYTQYVIIIIFCARAGPRFLFLFFSFAPSVYMLGNNIYTHTHVLNKRRQKDPHSIVKLAVSVCITYVRWHNFCGKMFNETVNYRLTPVLFMTDWTTENEMNASGKVLFPFG